MLTAGVSRVQSLQLLEDDPPRLFFRLGVLHPGNGLATGKKSSKRREEWEWFQFFFFSLISAHQATQVSCGFLLVANERRSLDLSGSSKSLVSPGVCTFLCVIIILFWLSSLLALEHSGG